MIYEGIKYLIRNGLDNMKAFKNFLTSFNLFLAKILVFIFFSHYSDVNTISTPPVRPG